MKAGVGSQDITPEIGMRTELFQNLFVDKIVTPLLVKICIIEGQELSAALVTADVMDFFSDSCGDIRRVVSDVTGIGEKYIFLNASHTHSAPYICPTAQRYLEKWGTGFLDLNYYDHLLQAVRTAAISARDSREEVCVRYSRGYVSGVASNRRVAMEDGKIGVRYGRNVPEELRRYPDGLIDPYAECVWLEKANGELKCALVNYACHGTSYNQYSEICWDYMGYAREEIERKLGGQVLFLQGCAGNISPGKYTTGEPLEDARLLGSRLAKAVTNSYRDRSPVDSEAANAVNRTVILKGRTTLSRDDLEARLKEELARVKIEQRRGSTAFYGSMVISYLERLLMLDKYPTLEIPCEIGLIRIGGLHLFFLPSESFIQYALEIKDHLKGKPVLVMAYGDCTLQYIPNEAAYVEKGGMEDDPDWCYSERGNGEALVKAAIRLADTYEGNQVLTEVQRQFNCPASGK